MSALARPLDARSVSQTATEEVRHHNFAAQYIAGKLQDADEANLLDEEDMHVFGLRPMTDPLDLVCCNACKKPIKASHYAAHAEFCRSFSPRMEISPELDGPAVNKKPPRKERKKSLTQTKKATSVRELKKPESVDSDDIAAPESHIDEKTEITPTEVKRNMHPNSTHRMTGSRVNPYDVDFLDATKRSSKPLKRTAAQSQSNPGTNNLCQTDAEVLPYVPAPLATKIYYSQRNHHLRRAIRHMFFEDSSKESISEVSNVEGLQVNTALTQISFPGSFFHEEVANQQRDDYFLHLARTPDQSLAARSDFYVGRSGAFVPSMNKAAQLPMDDTLGPHYMSNSYSFADRPGNPLGTLQQDGGYVPVVQES